MKDIHQCVICGQRLRPDRSMVDTCGQRCYAALLNQQRRRNGFLDALDRQTAGNPLRSLVADAAVAVEEIDPDELERWAHEVGP